MKVPEHIFFDLDHTLWDYERNSKEALLKLYVQFELQARGLIPLEKFLEAFRKANLQVWDLFDENRVNSDSLRHKRLELVFEEFGLPTAQIEGFHESYYEHCTTGIHLIDGALDLLQQLHGSYLLHIITNGFNDSQSNKLRHTGLEPFFTTVTTSESAGSKKPDAAYFDYALKQAGARKDNSLVVGDGLRTDVAGSVNYGLPVIWFNPDGLTSEIEPIRVVARLDEIIPILKSFAT